MKLGDNMGNQYDELKEYIKKEIPKKSLLGDIRITESQYQLLVEYFIYQTTLPTKSYPEVGYTLKCDAAYAVALVQIGIHCYDGGFWPHIEKILGKKVNNSIRERIDDRFLLTLKRYNKIVENDSEIVNTILLHGFVSNHYIGYLFDYLYRFYVIDLERDIKWEGFNDSLNYMIDMIQKGENESLSQTNRKYMLVKQTVDGIRVSKKQSVGMKFRWLLRTIDKLVFEDEINENSNSRLVREFINWSRNSENKKGFDKNYKIESSKYKLKKNISPRIIYNPKNNKFMLNIPGQRFLARHSAEVKTILTIGDLKESINLGRNELSTLIKTNDYERIIPVEDLFKPIKLEITIDTISKTYQVLTGDHFVVFDENYESSRIEKDRQILPKGQNYAFTSPNFDVYASCKLDAIIKNNLFINYSFNIHDNDYIVLNNNKLLIPNINVEDGLSNSYRIKNLRSGSLDVYSAVPLIFYKTNESSQSGTIIRVDGEIVKDNSFVRNVEKYADNTIQAILDTSKYIKHNGVHLIEIDVPNLPIKRYKFVYIEKLSFEFKNNPFIFATEGVVECSDANIHSKLENSYGIYHFEIDSDLEYLAFSYNENNINLPLELKVPILKIELPNGDITTDSLNELWHKNFPFNMKIRYENPYSILVDNDTEYDQTIDAQLHDGYYICDLTKLKTFIYEGEDIISKLYILCENQSFLLATVFLSTQILNVSKLNFDENQSQLMLNISVNGDDTIFASINHVETNTEICNFEKVINDELNVISKGLAGHYIVEFYIKKSGFGQNYKIIKSLVCELDSENYDDITFNVIRHYKGIRKFSSPYEHSKKQFITNLKKISQKNYSANLMLYGINNDNSSQIQVKILNKDAYLICKFQIIGSEDRNLYFDKKNKKIIKLKDNLNQHQNNSNIMYLDNYTFDIKMININKKRIEDKIAYLKKWGNKNSQKRGILNRKYFEDYLDRHNIDIEIFIKFLEDNSDQLIISSDKLESLFMDLTKNNN